MKLNAQIIKLKQSMDRLSIKPVYFVPFIFLSLGAALFDGISIGLLVPMARGVIGMNFDFVRSWPLFKTIISSFPQVFINTAKANSSIFILLLGIIFISAVMKDILWYFSSLATSYQATQFCKKMREINTGKRKSLI